MKALSESAGFSVRELLMPQAPRRFACRAFRPETDLTISGTHDYPVRPPLFWRGPARLSSMILAFQRRFFREAACSTQPLSISMAGRIPMSCLWIRVRNRVSADAALIVINVPLAGFGAAGWSSTLPGLRFVCGSGLPT
jgi:hypothetical protein